MHCAVLFHLSSVVSLELEHLRDGLAGLEELVLRDLTVAVEIALAETALHLVVDLVVVQRLALEEELTLRDAAKGNTVSPCDFRADSIHVLMRDLTP